MEKNEKKKSRRNGPPQPPEECGQVSPHPGFKLIQSPPKHLKLWPRFYSAFFSRFEAYRGTTVLGENVESLVYRSHEQNPATGLQCPSGNLRQAVGIA